MVLSSLQILSCKTIADLTYTTAYGDLFLDPWISDEYNEVEKALMEVQGTGEYVEDTPPYIKEWCDLDGDIVFGDHTENQWYQNLWDEHEMSKDMDAFESDNGCQMYLAGHGITDDTRTICEVKITHRGDNYLTGATDIGKVYIPKQLGHLCLGDTITCKMVYAGVPECREAYGIKMPWRATYIIQQP
jgi:hypothetical protein